MVITPNVLIHIINTMLTDFAVCCAISSYHGYTPLLPELLFVGHLVFDVTQELNETIYT